MVQVREVTSRNSVAEVDANYDDVYSDYTDSESTEDTSTHQPTWTRFIPDWLSSGRWTTKLWSRICRYGQLVGNIAWTFTTSMLLIGLPVLFAYDREKALQEQQLMGLPAPNS